MKTLVGPTPAQQRLLETARRLSGPDRLPVAIATLARAVGLSPTHCGLLASQLEQAGLWDVPRIVASRRPDVDPTAVSAAAEAERRRALGLDGPGARWEEPGLDLPDRPWPPPAAGHTPAQACDDYLREWRRIRRRWVRYVAPREAPPCP